MDSDAGAAVLVGLDEQQRAAVVAPRGPLCVLAGAGTGKTRAITHRIAYAVRTGQVPAAQILAVTFTTRAAGEMRARLRDLGVPNVSALTFHAAALRQLTYFWTRLTGRTEPPRVVDRKAQLIAQALSAAGIRPERTVVRDVTAEVEWAKATMVAPEGYLAAARRRQPPLPADQLAAVYAGYEQVKSRSGQVDFDDLLLVMAAAMEDYADVAEQVRARYRSFVVDEYQDVNPVQQRLLIGWLGSRSDLTVVGDASQTIYTFAGASPGYLIDFARRHPGATVVRLERDYRSTPQVVDLANRVIAGARGPLAAVRLRLVGQRPPGPVPQVRRYADEPAEAAGTAARCQELIAAGLPPEQIAVLFRTNAQSAGYEQALATAGVPYVVRGGERFFDRPEVREGVLLLRGAARGADADESDRPLPGRVADVLSAAGFVPGEPPAGGAARERWEGLSALVGLAEEVAAGDPQAGLTGFVAELRARAASQHVPTVRGVVLCSLHAAKGMEWDAVFVVGLVEGMLPISYAVTAEDEEEERRLLYVGVTRARERLVLSWGAARSPGGRSRRPSRFLDGLGSGAALGDGPGPAPGGERTARRRGPVRCVVCGRALAAGPERKLRRCLTCPGDVDEAVFGRLRDWRLARSREQQVPAYVVFTDATLTALAEARPVDLEALARIPGVGPRKLDQYGAEVLAVIRG